VFYRINSKENPEVVRGFLQKESLEVPVLLDRTGGVERLFGVWVHPTSYLIGKEGKMRYRAMGVFDWNGLQGTSAIDQLLKER
jgi:peroxiredoxin